MARYYEAKALIDFIKKNVPHFNGETTTQCVENAIREAPYVDVVSKGVYEQVQWERDIAMQQLEEHGIPFCGKADVVKVVRCEKCRHTESITDVDGNYGLYCVLRNSKFVNPDDFCSSGERKEQTWT